MDPNAGSRSNASRLSSNAILAGRNSFAAYNRSALSRWLRASRSRAPRVLESRNAGSHERSIGRRHERREARLPEARLRTKYSSFGGWKAFHPWHTRSCITARKNCSKAHVLAFDSMNGECAAKLRHPNAKQSRSSELGCSFRACGKESSRAAADAIKMAFSGSNPAFHSPLSAC